LYYWPGTRNLEQVPEPAAGPGTRNREPGILKYFETFVAIVISYKIMYNKYKQTKKG
jgi:hypothetical protein